jgi:hypothetical protein
LSLPAYFKSHFDVTLLTGPQQLFLLLKKKLFQITPKCSTDSWPKRFRKETDFEVKKRSFIWEGKCSAGQAMGIIIKGQIQ